MTKRTSAKYKIDRRMGENIWGRPKSPVNKREYGPGQHGQRRKGKVSDFGIQLKAKQKLKGYYGDVTEKQFKATYQKAAAMKGDTGQNLIGLLARGVIQAPTSSPVIAEMDFFVGDHRRTDLSNLLKLVEDDVTTLAEVLRTLYVV